MTVVGANGTGIFTQSGGTHTTPLLVVGQAGSGIGTYALSGGVTALLDGRPRTRSDRDNARSAGEQLRRGRLHLRQRIREPLAVRLDLTLDFGSRALNSGFSAQRCTRPNSAVGPADLLDRVFALLDPQDFASSGFIDFFNMAAGGITGALILSLDTTTRGIIRGTIVLHSVRRNASGYPGAIEDISLVVIGNVFRQRRARTGQLGVEPRRFGNAVVAAPAGSFS